MSLLNNVYTPPEAARIYGLSANAVRRACIEKRLKARKSGGTWLIPKKEMERVYGDKNK